MLEYYLHSQSFTCKKKLTVKLNNNVLFFTIKCNFKFEDSLQKLVSDTTGIRDTK